MWLQQLLRCTVNSLRSKGLLGCIYHVEEAVFVPLVLVNFAHGGGYTDHVFFID